MVSAQTRTWRDEAGQSPIIKYVSSSLLKHVMSCLFLYITVNEADEPSGVNYRIFIMNYWLKYELIFEL